MTASDAWTANRGIALTDDNSVALLAKHRLTSHAQVRLAIFRYKDSFYNPTRRHLTLGNKSLINFERAAVAQLSVYPTQCISQ